MKIGRKLREAIRKRAGNRCEYCRIPETYCELGLQVDHVRARKLSGPTNLENTCLACAKCNAAKGPIPAGFDPVTDALVPLYNPRIDEWADHFFWVGPIIEGRTAIGRATVGVLNMNAHYAIVTRQNLSEMGLFPFDGN